MVYVHIFFLPLKSLDEGVLDFQGNVDLKNAKHIYHIVEYYGPYSTPSTEEPIDIYLAKWVGTFKIHAFIVIASSNL